MRDFPTDLYAQLKEYAELHRRSIAQQTIAHVDSGTNAPGADAGLERTIRPWMSKLGVEASGARDIRSKRRSDAMALASEIRWKGAGPTAEEIAQLVRDGRESRAEPLAASLTGKKRS